METINDWKDRTLIWDLEGILIESYLQPQNINPETREILSLVKREGFYAQQGIWTKCFVGESIQFLEDLDLVKNLDFIIATDEGRSPYDELVISLRDGKRKRLLGLPVSTYHKDLTLLPGDAKGKVLIDDDERHGFPLDRRVLIGSYGIEEECSLFRAYAFSKTLF